MQKVTIDAELRARLNGLADQLEICDEAGQSLGHFLPSEFYRELLYAATRAEVIDEEELRQAREDYRAGRVMTTTEAIAYLEKLVQSRRASA